MSAPGKLYVQCNPLLDVSACVSDEFMKTYKLERGTASLLAEDQKNIFADLEKMSDVKYVPGGSGLNTARVAQWVLQAPKGTFVTYVGCASDDRYGKILRESAEKDGVTMALEYTTKEPTGSCAVCITGKERTLVANLAAANCLSAEHVSSTTVQKHLAESKITYFTGFTLTLDVNYVLRAAQKTREVGGIFMINLSAPFIIEFFGNQLDEVLPYVDVIFGNELEAHTLSRVKGWDLHTVAAIAERAARELPYTGKHGRLVVFTHGANSTVCAGNTNTTAAAASGSAEGGLVEVPVAPMASESIVDLNGAGDAFVGGFVAAYALGRDIKRCCEIGHYAAQVVIQHSGCTYPEKPTMSP
ncbi:adenosine kinase [Trypanosoma theileri]|uniref:Adenosine kinase n=1 Tax=Trypanosoma theileri TaxID=67003 RepID=A0A1X0P296_9TRYP|nr:adenosine kinase [Trypanosoma theileri]ORC90981.1 adenosine kinase [Trypanosoma theileri]